MEREGRPVIQVPLQVWGIGGLILLIPIIALVYWYLIYIQLVLTLTVFILGCVLTLKALNSMSSSVRGIAENVLGVMLKFEAVQKARHNNSLLESRANNFAEILPLLQFAVSEGRNIEFEGLKISDWKSNMHTLAGSAKDIKMLEGPEVEEDLIPKVVYFEDVVDSIPSGHTLLGIGQEGPITKSLDVTCCLWIVGGSGTGKTTTTSFRIEEKIGLGHKLLINDPHSHKPDSLFNATKQYNEYFIHPTACDTPNIYNSLEMFLKEFDRRKKGEVQPPYDLWTIVVDECNALNDPSDKDEEDLLEKLKRIARITGTESRNFGMEGVFISQYATGLSWLRKCASTVFCHKVLNWNERVIACNDDRKVARSMDKWSIGRTAVYGTSIDEGIIICQQPVKRGKLIVPDEKPTVNEEDFRNYWNMYVEQNNKTPSISMIESKFNCTNHRARQLREKIIT